MHSFIQGCSSNYVCVLAAAAALTATLSQTKSLSWSEERSKRTDRSRSQTVLGIDDHVIFFCEVREDDGDKPGSKVCRFRGVEADRALVCQVGGVPFLWRIKVPVWDPFHSVGPCPIA